MALQRTAVSAFADWIECQPTGRWQTFGEWHDKYWPDYAKHCYDISRNVYIMQKCVRLFGRLLVPGMTWKTAINSPTLMNKVGQVCLSVEVAPYEFFDDATTRIYQKRCLDVYEQYVSDGE
jgi:hypothetical protein